MEDENRLWALGLLDTSSTIALVYMVGALRSGNEHRYLRYLPSQIHLIQKPYSCLYLIYQEDISKTNQEGLHSRSKKLIHYANTTNPERCFVHVYKTYMSRYPSDRPAGIFYLQPLAKPNDFLVVIIHIAKIVPKLMKAAEFCGYYTNHYVQVLLPDCSRVVLMN